jgi:ferritin-like metal-binding protein YciE
MNERLLNSYLADAHAIELQALEQMRLAPRVARDPQLAAAFREHHAETLEHEQAVRDELERREHGPSIVKDLAGRVGGWGMILFARVNPDSPGKLAMHAYSYEHMELATYALLRRFAQREGDDRVVALAERIGASERGMADRISRLWDAAVDASLAAKGADDLGPEVIKYLRDAHALEAQAMQLLQAGRALAELGALADVFHAHLEQTREHQALIDERLARLGSRPSRFQAGAMRVSAMNLGGFFKLQPDTPVKLAGFAYAFEALEIGAYELLLRTAQRAGDDATAAIAQRILPDEREAADRVAATWDRAVDATLAARA